MCHWWSAVSPTYMNLNVNLCCHLDEEGRGRNDGAYPSVGVGDCFGGLMDVDSSSWCH